MGKPQPRTKKRRSPAQKRALEFLKSKSTAGSNVVQPTQDSGSKATKSISGQSYVETLQAQLLHGQNEITALGRELNEIRSENHRLQTDLEQAKFKFAIRLETRDAIARTHNQDMLKEMDVTRHELAKTADELNDETKQNRSQNKKIQRYQRSNKVSKARIQDLEDRVLSEASRSEAISREYASTIARLRKNLDNLGSQFADRRNQLPTLQRFKKR